jgi:long-chain acyl-CoA synthetase
MMSFEGSRHKSYAAGVPRNSEFEKITMPEVLTRTAQRFPNRIALIFMGKKITCRELEALDAKNRESSGTASSPGEKRE